jgi:hypothetical protein
MGEVDDASRKQEIKERHRGFWLEIIKDRDLLENVGLHGKIMLGWILTF